MLGDRVMGSATKHIQAEIDERLYLMLKSISIRTGKPLKELLQEAIEKYVEIEEKELKQKAKNDPIWKIVGKGELEENASEDEEWGLTE
ncbi:hypothetical protein [Thermococcus kodakarensis]|nr:hypothetical protein [Thermococcus kodakarensis]WCN27256.1 hypothetical protein POG15_06370 [Thermococcus kodakarensis]